MKSKSCNCLYTTLATKWINRGLEGFYKQPKWPQPGSFKGPNWGGCFFKHTTNVDSNVWVK